MSQIFAAFIRERKAERRERGRCPEGQDTERERDGARAGRGGRNVKHGEGVCALRALRPQLCMLLVCTEASDLTSPCLSFPIRKLRPPPCLQCLEYPLWPQIQGWELSVPTGSLSPALPFTLGWGPRGHPRMSPIAVGCVTLGGHHRV